MKKIIPISIALMLILTACGGGSPIVGTWSATYDDRTVEVTFNADGTLSQTMDDEKSEGTYTLKDSTLTLKSSEGDESVFTVEFKDDTLIMTDEYEESVTLKKK